jgi:hypothetical protein
LKAASYTRAATSCWLSMVGWNNYSRNSIRYTGLAPLKET